MPVHWRPVGPLPASTYWRRRAGVLAVVVVGLALAAIGLRSGGSGPDRLAAAPAPSSRPAPAASATPTTPTPSPTGAPECLNEALAIDAGTDATSYAAGARAALVVHVKNNSSLPCRRPLGTGAVEFVITSGSDRIWSSDDCAGKRDAGEVVLAPGSSQTVHASWPGTRSAPGCPGGQPTAQPGTYRLTARVGDLRVPGSVFDVTG